MKTRNGYVSNSSSSSFVICGKSITLKQARKLVNDNSKTIMCVAAGRGISGDVEDFIFRMTPYRLKQLKGIRIGDSKFFDVAQSWDLEWSNNIVETTCDFDDVEVIVCNKDNSSPDTDSDDDEKFKEWIDVHRSF